LYQKRESKSHAKSRGCVEIHVESLPRQFFKPMRKGNQIRVTRFWARKDQKVGGNT